jgi:hypothetical protein
MFTQHPKDSEFFDAETFIDENRSTLRDMYDQCKELPIPQDDDDYADRVAILIAASVYADKSQVTIPISVDEGDQEGVCLLATHLVLPMVLFGLEDKGLCETKQRGWTITEEGVEAARQIMKEKSE